jgi:hypothetical protein
MTPALIAPVRERPKCPVCGKVSYSAAGIHPQCASHRADAATRLREREKLAAAAKAAEAEASVALPAASPPIPQPSPEPGP